MTHEIYFVGALVVITIMFQGTGLRGAYVEIKPEVFDTKDRNLGSVAKIPIQTHIKVAYIYVRGKPMRTREKDLCEELWTSDSL